MTTRKELQDIRFIIDHIDPLGQGVFKEDEKVYFIPKTLPGESGLAQVVKKKKNLYFCKLIELDQKSPQRQNSECPHYHTCSGCHFLHTDYESELSFKLNSFKRLLQKFEHDEIKLVKSPQRLHYRNRIQLHRERSKIGFYQYNSRQITEVPECKIIQEELRAPLKQIYKNPPRFKSHIELYYKDGEVEISKDSRYAQSGFTQVNQKTNSLMLKHVKELFSQEKLDVMDLFAGDGNISSALAYKSRMCLDIYPHSYAEFINLDLFKPHAIDQIRETTVDLLILDPPRSGFKELRLWAQKFRPQKILYISCHPMTMIRDIKEMIEHYKISQVSMIDLFPGTFHFEGLIVLERR